MRICGKMAVVLAVGIVALAGLRADEAWAAGPSDFLKIVPASHEVFAYFDVAQARKSKLYADLKVHLLDDTTSGRLAAFEQWTGVRLPDDIDAVAASARIAPDNNGCVYVRGRWDRQRIQGLFMANPDYAEVAKPGGKIINFRDEQKGTVNSLSFLTENLLAIGNSSAVEAALSAFAGQGPTLAQNAIVRTQVAEYGTSPAAMVVAVRPQQLPPNLVEVPGITNLQSVLFLLQDGPDAMTVVARIQADSAQMAAKWLDIVRGVIALGQIQNRVPRLAEIANRTTAVQRGSGVEVKTQLKVADASEFFQQQIGQRRSQRPNFAGRRIRQGGAPGQGPKEPAAPAQW